MNFYIFLLLSVAVASSEDNFDLGLDLGNTVQIVNQQTIPDNGIDINTLSKGKIINFESFEEDEN